MPEKGSRPHYSYATYADPAMAAGFDNARFGGAIGQMLLQDQERVLFTCLGDVSGKKILDVGTGTGRAALALAARGAHVVGIDASAEMLSVARRRASDARVAVDFIEGDAHALQFGDRSFDAVVCLRMLMHVPDWRRSLGELCRVADHQLVLDFPSATSVAAVQSAWRRAAASLGSEVESYRVFTPGRFSRELLRRGFHVSASHRQFVLPIAFYKLLDSPPFTRRVEAVFAATGVLRVCGSPVTISAERCVS